MKRTPTLEFTYDKSIDQGMRIQAILRSVGVESVGVEGGEDAAAPSPDPTSSPHPPAGEDAVEDLVRPRPEEDEQ
ncbi:MAG: hypothetical protein H5T84_01610 [Thermoleophilia bacterium]|nr:hypothetical protein [Thermoleophilia bacterium]